jgi:hypothetical protein
MKFPQVLTCLIARREGERPASRFVSVIEPFRDEPLLRGARSIQLSTGAGTAVELARGGDGGSDLIVYDPSASDKSIRQDGVSTDAQIAVVRRDASGRMTGRFFAGGRFLTVEGDRLTDSGATGAVVSVHPDQAQICIKPDRAGIKPDDFVGRVVHFSNELRRTSHTIAAAARDADEIVLTASDDLLVGRARVDQVRADVVTTRTAMLIAPAYRGVTLASSAFQPLARVVEVQNGSIKLETAIAERHAPAPGDDVWLINVGPGDRFELPSVADESR